MEHFATLGKIQNAAVKNLAPTPITPEVARRTWGLRRCTLEEGGAREVLLELTSGSYLLTRQGPEGFAAVGFEGPAGLVLEVARREPKARLDHGPGA